MSIFDGRRLRPETFDLDVEKIRRGYYTDEYFNNTAWLLRRLARTGYRFMGRSPALPKVDLSDVDVGNLEAMMQVFTVREPFSVVSGVDHALAILRTCTGYCEGKKFVNTARNLKVQALREGDVVRPRQPVMHIRGRYRDFAHLETLILGVLGRGTRIATNVYETELAARGKPLFYFSARFDLYQAQAADGYAYKMGVERYNRDHRGKAPLLISTDAQGEWWKARGSGTTPHAYLVCFLRDTVEAMLRFAQEMPRGVRRIALVDVNNDCVNESAAVAKAFFQRYWQLLAAGKTAEAQRYRLYAVRPDTARNLMDRSLAATGIPEEDFGVNVRLVKRMRRTLDRLGDTVEVPAGWRPRAREYFRSVRIVATGGFTPERIRRMERRRAPVDAYGVGSSLIRGPVNDYTADLVKVKLHGRWVDMAKVGRKALPGAGLAPVHW